MATYTIWYAVDPQGDWYDGDYQRKTLNAGTSFAIMCAFARGYAIQNACTVMIERADFADEATREWALDCAYESLNDAYIAEGERQAEEMWRASHDEPCYLLVGAA